MLLLAISAFLWSTQAQRPSNASQCDYYATQLYSSNTTTTQFNLVQSILALAFAGGSGVSNVTSDITGIFNPGSFQNTIFNLQPWFNGSIYSTNLNNQPSNVDWLNGGGNAPLTAFLTGETSSVLLNNRTNE